MSDRGLFVDLDGTLSDSIPGLRRAYYDFLLEHGIEGHEDEFQSLNGPPLGRIIASLKQAHELVQDVTALTSRYLALVQRAHRTAPLAVGALRLVTEARLLGWKTAVVTSSPRSAAIDWLDRHRLFDRVDAVVGGDEVSRGKPEPEPYLTALARVGCAAVASIAVEDSRLGAASAVAAGLSTWAIADAASRHGWPAGVSFIDGLPALSTMLREC